jgi:hypothetical protein
MAASPIELRHFCTSDTGELECRPGIDFAILPGADDHWTSADASIEPSNDRVISRS